MAEKKKPGCFAMLLSALILMGLLVAGCMFGGYLLFDVAAPKFQETLKNMPPPEATPSVTISPELQAKRLALMNDVLKTGYIAKIESRPPYHASVWITPRFYGLTFDQKKSLISIIYAYHFPNTDSIASVDLIDNLNGKKVGEMSSTGLKIY